MNLTRRVMFVKGKTMYIFRTGQSMKRFALCDMLHSLTYSYSEK